MRLAAFSFLLSAAFDWELPWLDRPGMAALGLAFGCLSLPLRPLPMRRPAKPDFPAKRLTLPEPQEEALSGLAERLAGYGSP